MLCMYVCTVSLYEEMIHMYHVRVVSLYKEMVLPFLCMKKWYVAIVSSYKGTVLTVSLCKEMVCVPFLYTENDTYV